MRRKRRRPLYSLPPLSEEEIAFLRDPQARRKYVLEQGNIFGEATYISSQFGDEQLTRGKCGRVKVKWVET